MSVRTADDIACAIESTLDFLDTLAGDDNMPPPASCAIDILRKLIAKEPLATDEIACMHCGATIGLDPVEPHSSACPYFQAIEFLRNLE